MGAYQRLESNVGACRGSRPQDRSRRIKVAVAMSNSVLVHRNKSWPIGYLTTVDRVAYQHLAG